MNIKKILAFLMLSTALTGTAFASGYTGQQGRPVSGGYTGPNSERITTVAQAKNAHDDAHVILEGFITKRLQNNEYYEFKDTTGTITVEIDNDDWPAQSIDDKTKVRLFGEVDKDMFNTEIDVDYLEVIN